MVNPRLIGPLRQRVLEHMKRLAGPEKAKEDLRSGLSPSEAIEVDSLLNAALSRAGSARHPRPPSTNKLSPRRAPLGHAPAPRPPTAGSSGASLSEEDLVSIAKKLLAGRGIAPIGRPASSSVARQQQQQQHNNDTPSKPPSAPASTDAPVPISAIPQRGGGRPPPAASPALSARGIGKANIQQFSVTSNDYSAFLEFEERRRQQEAEQAARTKALQDAIDAAAERQRNEKVKTHQRVFPERREVITMDGDPSPERDPAERKLPPPHEMMQQISELRGHSGKGRPASASNVGAAGGASPRRLGAPSWAATGMTSLEKMRDRLVQQKIQRSQQREQVGDFFFDDANSNNNNNNSNSNGQHVEAVPGWTPDRRDGIKQKYLLGREHLRAGLDQQLKERAAERERCNQQMRDENQAYTHFILDGATEEAERKRRRHMMMDKAADAAHKEIAGNYQKRKEDMEHQHEIEARMVAEAKREAEEEERYNKMQELKKKARLHRELSTNAQKAVQRKEDERRRKQEEEAEILEQNHRALVNEQRRKQELLHEAWARHKSHADALRRETEAHQQRTDRTEKAEARALADQARAADDAEKELRKADRAHKMEEQRQELLTQMYMRSLKEQAAKDRDKDEADRRIGLDTASRSAGRFERMHEAAERQADFRRFLELQMQVGSLKNDTEDERLSTRLKAKRTMSSLCQPPRWSEAALAGSSARGDRGIERRPDSASQSRSRLW